MSGIAADVRTMVESEPTMNSYIVAQVIGGVLGGFAIAPRAGTFATNGFGPDGSPGGCSMTAALVTEIIMTAVFLVVIMGATAKRAAAGMGGLAIGLALTLIHFISISVTNTSVNPARSTGQALIASVFGEGVSLPMQQLWLFWAAPIVGAVLGAVLYRSLIDANDDVVLDLAEPSADAREMDLEALADAEERARRRLAAEGERAATAARSQMPTD